MWIIGWSHLSGSDSNQRRAERPARRLRIAAWHVAGEIVNREEIVAHYILVLSQGRAIIPAEVSAANRCNVGRGGDGRNDISPGCQREHRRRKKSR